MLQSSPNSPGSQANMNSSLPRKKKQYISYDKKLTQSLWKELEADLSNFEYWSSTPSEAWDVTAYDSSLLKISYNNRRMAHGKLKGDLKLIKEAFPQHQTIQKGVTTIQNDIKKISKNNENQFFWETTAISLNKNARELEVASTSLKKSAINAVTQVVEQTFLAPSTSAPIAISPSSSSSSSSSQQHKKKKHKVHDNEFELNTDANDKSVATIIKNKAEKILDKLANNIEITASERKLMTNGLSSILDLSDDCHYSQRLLFAADMWDQLKKTYQDKYAIESIELPAPITTIWKIVCQKIETTRSVISGLKYLYQIYAKYFNDDTMFVPLKVLESVLNSVREHPHLLQRESAIDVTEYDYLGHVWLPVFNIMFTNQSNIRIKTNESTFEYTTERKVEQYPEAANVIGYKIDIRFLVDFDKHEFDLCSGEMAKSDDSSKITNDKAKLNREAKDDIDCMLDLCEDDEWVSCVGWQFQSAGSSCAISSIHLADSGLYVVLPRYDFKLPSSIAELADFLPTLSDLFTWRAKMYESADSLIMKLNRSYSSRLLSKSPSSASHITSMQRDTFYTPPQGSRIRKPLNLYGYTPTNLMEKLLSASRASTTLPSTSASSTSASSTSPPDNLEYDANGWARTGSQWYNRIADVYWDKSPYDE